MSNVLRAQQQAILSLTPTVLVYCVAWSVPQTLPHHIWGRWDRGLLTNLTARKASSTFNYHYIGQQYANPFSPIL